METDLKSIRLDYRKFCRDLNKDLYSRKSVKEYILDSEIWYSTLYGFYPQKNSIQELKQNEYFNNLKIALKDFTPYRKKQEELRNKAIDFQMDFCNNDYDYLELANIQADFEKQAKKYGLVKEFRENCII